MSVYREAKRVALGGISLAKSFPVLLKKSLQLSRTAVKEKTKGLRALTTQGFPRIPAA